MLEGTTLDAALSGLVGIGLVGISLGCLGINGVGVEALPTKEDLRESVEDAGVASSEGIIGCARGVQGRIVTGTCSGKSTVKVRLKGHSVFSNCRILSNTSLSSSARC
jgi:hypothetical protein